MTLQEIKFLKLAHKLTNKTELNFYYDEFDHSIHLYGNSSTQQPCKELSNEIHSLEKSLEDHGYLALTAPEGLNDQIYHLTHKGLHYLKFSLNALLSFLFKSILVPIIVAFVTALLVSA